MKKLISLFLTLTLALSMTACGSSKKDAQEAAQGFMDAFIKLDYDGIKEYIDDETAIPESIKNLDADKVVESLPAELSEYSEDFESIFNDVIKKATDDMSYEIKGIEKNNKDYEVTVEVTLPDFENIDIESVIGEQLNKEAMTNLLMEMISSGEITDFTDQKAIMDVLMPKIVEIAKDAIADIEIETTTEEKVIVVVKEDDKWLVSAEKSEIDD